MQLLLLLAALITLAGIVVTIAGLRSAPMGYEDGDGFHVIASPKAALQAARRRQPARPREHVEAPGVTPHAA